VHGGLDYGGGAFTRFVLFHTCNNFLFFFVFPSYLVLLFWRVYGLEFVDLFDKKKKKKKKKKGKREGRALL
jgi:hypothetical protein